MNISFLFEKPIRQNCGGIERVTHLLATQFKNMGHNVIFISTSPSSDTRQENIVFEQICIKGPKINHGAELQKIINDYSIDVVINQSVIFSTLNLLPYINSTNAKLLTVLHNRPFCIAGQERYILSHTYPIGIKSTIIKLIGLALPSIYGKFRENQIRNMYSKIVKYSDKFILLSDKFKLRLLKYCPNLDMRKVDSINNPNTFIPANDLLNRKENLVIFVGRQIDPQKNVKEFIDVWNKFSSIQPEWRALIIGEGPHRHIFEKYALHTNSKNLSFIGNQTDMAPYYSKAKFLCMTSTYEGWPMVIAEALSYGCIPCVYDTFESCRDIISPDTGCIIEPYDSQLMADAMLKIANDKDMFTKMSNGAKLSIDKYNPDIIAKIWLDKIASITKQ